MGVETKTAAIFVAAAVLRLGAFFFLPAIATVLSERVEIATPLSSYKRLLEGLFLFERGVSPYDGGVYHQAPLLLVVFELLPSALVFTGLDLLNAWNLVTIAQRLRLPSPRFSKLDGSQLALAYLFNPFSIISCLGSSTTIFTNATILQAIASATAGNAFGAMFAIACSTYLSLYPALLLPPLILQWARSKSTQLQTSTVLSLVGIFTGTLAILLSSSAILVGNFKDFIVSCYGAQINITDLTPNMGLWWYFFIEIFDAFRSFFIGVFWIHLVGYVGALTVRLPEQPLFVIIALIGLITIFKPYPSTSDVSLYLGVLPLYKHVMPLTRYTFLAASVLLYSTLLGPAFYHIWIYAGSGNANFFYAITLVWSLGLSMLVGDSLFAVLRDEWEMLRPEMRGKDIRQI
ncbi:hypothetical protein OHC33_006198 [Knufia fluminis]|uniref:Phosphatidylinositol glycan anchor biosynthesis class U protein n=1 Tax=Knufia fluminis TaxID=191047 RepID=A0AAN8ESG6_9EURO|nr:hypothetical protein OHC33_006198 [Knufia fluminis]